MKSLSIGGVKRSANERHRLLLFNHSCNPLFDWFLTGEQLGNEYAVFVTWRCSSCIESGFKIIYDRESEGLEVINDLKSRFNTRLTPTSDEHSMFIAIVI